MACKLYLNKAILEEEKWRIRGEEEGGEGEDEEEKDQGRILKAYVEEELNISYAKVKN